MSVSSDFEIGYGFLISVLVGITVAGFMSYKVTTKLIEIARKREKRNRIVRERAASSLGSNMSDSTHIMAMSVSGKDNNNNNNNNNNNEVSEQAACRKKEKKSCSKDVRNADTCDRLFDFLPHLFSAESQTNVVKPFSSAAAQLENALKRREAPTIGQSFRLPVPSTSGSFEKSVGTAALPAADESIVNVLCLEQRLFLMRHAERADHADPKWRTSRSVNAVIPSTDPPLSDLGRRQAAETGVHLLHNILKKGSSEAAAAWGQTFVVSSPYLRCLETALLSWLVGTDSSIPFLVDARLGDFVQAKCYKEAPTLCGEFVACDLPAEEGKGDGRSELLYVYRVPRECFRGLLEWADRWLFNVPRTVSDGGKDKEKPKSKFPPILPKWVGQETIEMWRRKLQKLLGDSDTSDRSDQYVQFPTTSCGGGLPDATNKSIFTCYPESKSALAERCRVVLHSLAEDNGKGFPIPRCSRDAFLARDLSMMSSVLDRSASSFLTGTSGPRQVVTVDAFSSTPNSNADEEPSVAEEVEEVAKAGHRPVPFPFSALVCTHADNVAACVTALCPSYYDSRYFGSGVAVPYASITVLRRLAPKYALCTLGPSVGGGKGSGADGKNAQRLRRRRAPEDVKSAASGGKSSSSLLYPDYKSVFERYLARHCLWAVGEGPSHGANAAFSGQPSMGSMDHLVTSIRVTK